MTEGGQSMERRRARIAYDAAYAGIGHGHLKWFSNHDNLLPALIDAARDAGFRTVLSLGAGNGTNEQRLAKELGLDIICLDFNKVPLDRLKRRVEGRPVSGLLHPVQADMLKLPVAGHFDMVLAGNVMQDLSLKEQAGAIDDWKACTNPGGIHLVSTARNIPIADVDRWHQILRKNYADCEILMSGIKEGARNGRAYVMARMPA